MVMQELKIAPAPRQVAEQHPPDTQAHPPQPPTEQPVVLRPVNEKTEQ